MPAVFDVQVAALRKTGSIRFAPVSGGSTLSVKSSATLSSRTADDSLNGGLLFLIDNSASCVKQIRRISDYDASSGEFTFTVAVDTAPSSGTFGYTVKPEIEADTLMELTNDALRAVGPLSFVDKNTIYTSAAQSVYAGSTLWGHTPPTAIDIQTGIVSTADDPQWRTFTPWHPEPSSVGGTINIVLEQGVPANRYLRVWYDAFHPRVSVSTAAIDGRINQELIVLLLADRLYEYKFSVAGGVTAFDTVRWNGVKQELVEAKIRYPLWKPPKRNKIGILGDQRASGYPDPPPYGPG